MRIRPAEPAEYPALAMLERAADAMFARLGIVFEPGSVLDIPDPAHTVLVAGTPAVGFVVTGPVDDGRHVHQLAVHPGHGRRGIGSALLAEVVRAAPGPVTLTTFEQVPWNMPWYLRRGFAVLPPAGHGPQLRAIVAAERAAGLHRLGPRVTLVRAADLDRLTGE